MEEQIIWHDIYTKNEGQNCSISQRKRTIIIIYTTRSCHRALNARDKACAVPKVAGCASVST